MKYLRFASSLLLAGAVTFGLLFLMMSLIDTGFIELEDKPSRRMADIYMPESSIEARVEEKRVEKPDQPDEPPPEIQPPVVDNFDLSENSIEIAPPSQLKLNISVNAGGISASDGEYLPIVKVNPVYPRRANSRGIEGYCIIEYTVTTTGSIRSPEAVDCQPKGVFEKTSLKAARPL